MILQDIINTIAKEQILHIRNVHSLNDIDTDKLLKSNVIIQV